MIIGTTESHPFWVVGQGWTAAGGLRIGDQLVGHDGMMVTVQGVAPSVRVVPVYNVEVEDDHTYFVKGDGWSLWAHNATYEEGDTAERPRETPYRDPEPRDYNNGAVEMDHENATVWGNEGPATRELPAETNRRRGGHDGRLHQEYEANVEIMMAETGCTRAHAEGLLRQVYEAEIQANIHEPPPRPTSPHVLDQLPQNPLDQLRH